jgi:PadR family transcriptional regulator PadR
VFTLNARGQEQLDDFWRAWTFLAERLDHLRHTTSSTNGQD